MSFDDIRIAMMCVITFTVIFRLLSVATTVCCLRSFIILLGSLLFILGDNLEFVPLKRLYHPVATIKIAFRAIICTKCRGINVLCVYV